MPSDRLDFSVLIGETADAARRALLVTWKWGLFCLIVAAGTGAFGDASNAFQSLMLSIANLLASCTWGYFIYRALRPGEPEDWQAGIVRLVWASLLVGLLFLIVAFISGLFVVIVSALLIAVSGYDPSMGEVGDVDGSIAALRESGAIWIVYMLGAAFIAFLAWFAIRLILFGAATVDRGKILVLQTWRLTEAAFWPIAGLAVVLIGVPTGLGLWASDMASQAIGLASDLPFLGSEASGPAQATSMTQRALDGLFQTGFGVPAFLLGHALASRLYVRLANDAVFE